MSESMPPVPDENETPDDDWSDAPHRVDNVQFTHRGQHHYQVNISTDAHRVAVSISPQGRSVRVWLDGIPMTEEPAAVRQYVARAVDGAR